MKLEEYLKTLPKGIISGEDVQLSENSLRDIFNFVKLNENDVFYHLGCGDGRGVSLAAKEFNVRKSIGIDINHAKIPHVKSAKNINFLCKDITNSSFEDATVILFWFTDQNIISNMLPLFEQLSDGCKIVTIWNPLSNYIPHKVQFPYIINQVPLKPAKDLKEQILAVFGVKCIDFVTAWEHAERYTKAIELHNAENNRFLTIMQSLIIWINAKNLGVACGKDMPESIRTYIGILEHFFGIEVKHLLE